MDVSKFGNLSKNIKDKNVSELNDFFQFEQVFILKHYKYHKTIYSLQLWQKIRLLKNNGGSHTKNKDVMKKYRKKIKSLKTSKGPNFFSLNMIE